MKHLIVSASGFEKGSKYNIRKSNLRHVYAHKFFLPSPKWRHYLLQNLPWLPEGFNELVNDDVSLSLTEQSFYRRRMALSELFDKCIDRAEELALLPDNINELYNQWFFSETDSNSEENNYHFPSRVY